VYGLGFLEPDPLAPPTGFLLTGVKAPPRYSCSILLRV
jgi:hypothetical protein